MSIHKVHIHGRQAWYICIYDWGKISKQQTRGRERKREREREREERCLYIRYIYMGDWALQYMCIGYMIGVR